MSRAKPPRAREVGGGPARRPGRGESIPACPVFVKPAGSHAVACSAPAPPPRPAPCSARCPAPRQHLATAGAGDQRRADVAIVGAGFAGLTAARELAARATRWSCSRPATGSAARVLNAEIGGGEITERGGTFTGPTQDRLIALAEQHGSRHLPDLQQRREPLHRQRRRGCASPTPARPVRRRRIPVILPDLALIVARSRPEVDHGAGRRPVDGAEGRRVGRPDARGVHRGERDHARSSRRWSRSRPGRSSAPSRASSRCSTCSSTSPPRATRRTPARSSATSTPATVRRCSASRVARS